jgi:hypothetical protein
MDARLAVRMTQRFEWMAVNVSHPGSRYYPVRPVTDTGAAFWISANASFRLS